MESQIRGVYRSWGDLTHHSLREQITLILFSGLCRRCFIKLRGFTLRLEKGSSPPYPQHERKGTQALQIYYPSFLMCREI